MRLTDSFLPPMHPEGRRFVAAFAGASVLLYLAVPVLGLIGLGLTIWCYYFFRDPARVTPVREGLIVSPADGIVSAVATAVPPPELGLSGRPLMRISIFMSVFNCHVNRAPIEGRIEKVAYKPGRFLSASLDKASDENERNGLIIAMADGRRLGVVQIAGLVARRIVCFVGEGTQMDTGQRFGLIRFGSRLDIYLPDGVAPLVCEGQTTTAGETVIADLATDEPARAGRKD